MSELPSIGFHGGSQSNDHVTIAPKPAEALRLHTPVSKAKIRRELRKIYDDAGDDPPNVNRAWDLLKVKLPHARSRVREVLREDEFARRRRKPGKRRLTTSSGIATAKPADLGSEI
jgi:hypothetical protein